MNTVSNLVMPSGKTWKQECLAKKHNIPLWSLVELEDGRRLYVVKHERDCDGSPLYALTGFSQHDYSDRRRVYGEILSEHRMDILFIQASGIDEGSLKVIKRAT